MAEYFVAAKDREGNALQGSTVEGWSVKTDKPFDVSKDDRGAITIAHTDGSAIETERTNGGAMISNRDGNQFSARTIDMRSATAGASMAITTKENGAYSAIGDGTIKIQEGIVNMTEQQATQAVPSSAPAPQKPTAS